MSDLRNFRRAGHWPTLFASFLYFDFCFAIWVLNGAMAPFISETFHLIAAQKGFMLSVPIIAGALMRFPLGVLAQYIGRKNAALVEMGLIVVALVCRLPVRRQLPRRARHGRAAGHRRRQLRRRAVAWARGWFPPRYKGLAMGIAGAGNSGTVLAVLFAPPLALRFGWSAVYGLAALTMLLPLAVMWFAAKEPPDIERQTLREHVACLFERDGWAFSLDLRRDLRRLHRARQLPADLLPRPVQGDQGARPASSPCSPP